MEQPVALEVSESASSMTDIEYLCCLVAPLLEFPDLVEIKRKADVRGVMLFMKLAPSDTGKVIGMGGSTALAIRSLLRQYGAIRHIRISLKILDSNDELHGND